MHAPADHNQRQRKPAQIKQRLPWTVAQHGLRLEYGIVRNEISQAYAYCQSRRKHHAQRVAKRPEQRYPNRMRPYRGTADRKWSSSSRTEALRALKTRDKLRGAHRGDLGTPVKRLRMGE